MAALTVDFRRPSGQTPADDMAPQNTVSGINSPVLLLGPSKTLLIYLVQEWLDTSNATFVFHVEDSS